MPNLEFSNLFSPENPVFSGGFGLAVLAASAQILRQGYQVGWKAAKRYILVTLEVTSKDRSYPWVLQWLTAKGMKTQHLSVETFVRPTTSQQASMSFSLVPGPGQHVLAYKGHILLVQRIREQNMMDLNSGKPWEKIQFTSIGRNTSIFSEILNDAYELSVTHEEGKTIVFTNWGSEWRQFGQPRRKRSLESVILDEGVSDKLYSDVTEWIQSSQWYTDRGIPYRRGYLLHGPPGSGKSSFIYALAGKLDYNICILNLAERGLTDDRLAMALSSVPPHSIVLLEDIDAAFPNREATSSNSYYDPQQGRTSDVTFSGLLNVLDGVAASEDRLVFMTTNHIDRLDPALIRPGRVDYVQLIADATDYQIKNLYHKFYPEATPEQCDEFLQHLRNTVPTISMAALQGYLLRNKNDSLSAIGQLHLLLEDAENRHQREQLKKQAEEEKNKKASSEEEQLRLMRKGPVKPRPVRPLSVAEIDKMVFNPQKGWDSSI